MVNILAEKAIQLLQQLISIPSFSREEDQTANTIENFFSENDIKTNRFHNNVWAVNQHFDANKPIVLLNSHHDTVKPNLKYTKDPFQPQIEDGKLFGLGSNDAGGCLVSLIATFTHFYSLENLPFNLVIAATAEEEISGKNGIEALLQHAEFQTLDGRIPFSNWENWQAIVGEPTLLQLAVAEKGLMVLDATANGKAGHAARNEGENAIYKAMQDIAWFSSYEFQKISEWLGKVKMSVTVIETENKAHNVVPAVCQYVVDIRITDAYTHEEVLAIIQKNVQSEVKARSFRLRSSRIDISNPLVKSGIKLGKKPFGSPTSSDKALMPFQALKCGPGDSARSHTADEFIYLNEIEEGIDFYIKMLEGWE
ncbi:M20 family metallo-hydrolase [Rhizosphaericola mali]|uniref:M20/M25/M40 family metallo-hydrolase n=1 Tax=Rhizosphaericola mali TaxID=2545455 RepID=A0A5P2G3X0_9BACT|nr:M20 family metallo-hydrolase [Rhizosphaericola mali]QES89907.1 M20/M25/M40 family metallo-hydrolase [Rhizosphaericola mali]